MTGRTHDRERPARVEPGPSLSLAQDILSSDAEQEAQFLARLEKMEVGPAGQYRRKQILALVVACLVVGTGAAAMVGILALDERPNGSAAAPPQAGHGIAPPEFASEIDPHSESSEQPAPEGGEPEIGLDDPPPLVFEPLVPLESIEPAAPAEAPADEALPRMAGTSVEPAPVTLPEDIRLLAQIELQRGSGTPPETRLEFLDDFVTRFPESTHVGEVRALTVEALADAGRNEEALDAAERYLALHPEDSRRQQVRWIEATVARDRLQDCARALPAYQELAGGTGPWKEAAEQYVEVCAP